MASIYALVFGSWALAGLVLVKPKIRRRGFILGALATYPVTFVIAQLGFVAGDSIGLVSYPLDESPYFFVSWFVVIWTALVLTAAVVVWVRLHWHAHDASPPRPEAK